jgi:hypothetical protein
MVRLSAQTNGRLYSEKLFLVLVSVGARGGAVVAALRYKPEGRGIDSRFFQFQFNPLNNLIH